MRCQAMRYRDMLLPAPQAQMKTNCGFCPQIYAELVEIEIDKIFMYKKPKKKKKPTEIEIK